VLVRITNSAIKTLETTQSDYIYCRRRSWQQLLTISLTLLLSSFAPCAVGTAYSAAGSSCPGEATHPQL